MAHERKKMLAYPRSQGPRTGQDKTSTVPTGGAAEYEVFRVRYLDPQSNALIIVSPVAVGNGVVTCLQVDL